MPRQPRTSKRKRPPEEVPSSISLEVISLVQKGGRITKKRVFEKTGFDPRASPLTFPDGAVLPAPFTFPNDDALPTPSSQVDSSTPVDGVFKEPSPDATSRSVSVRFFCLPSSLSTYPLSRPNLKNGFHVAQSSSMNSFAWKPLRLET